MFWTPRQIENQSSFCLLSTNKPHIVQATPKSSRNIKGSSQCINKWQLFIYYRVLYQIKVNVIMLFSPHGSYFSPLREIYNASDYCSVIHLDDNDSQCEQPCRDIEIPFQSYLFLYLYHSLPSISFLEYALIWTADCNSREQNPYDAAGPYPSTVTFLITPNAQQPRPF